MSAHSSDGREVITTADLVKAALRHRPRQIISGSVSGDEGADLLQAMNGEPRRLAGFRVDDGRTHRAVAGALVSEPPPRRGDFIHVWSGGQYWPMDPLAEDVSVRDVAHHLAKKCRFSGAVRRFYSVAEHAYLLSYVVEPHLAWAALHHDDCEAFLPDIPTPVKPFIVGWADVEAANDQATAIDAFGCTHEELRAIKRQDKAMAFDEAAALLYSPRGALPWWHGRNPGIVSPKAWGPRKAAAMFLRRHRELRAMGFGRDAVLDEGMPVSLMDQADLLLRGLRRRISGWMSRSA